MSQPIRSLVEPPVRLPAPALRETLHLEAVEADARRGFVLEVSRTPDRPGASLWLCVIERERHWSFASEVSAVGSPGVSPIDSSFRFEIDGVPWLELERTDDPASRIELRCAAPAHAVLSTPSGPGSHPVLLEARFEAGHVLETGSGLRTEVHGAVGASIAAPGFSGRLRGRGAWRETRAPEAPIGGTVHGTLRGPRTSLVLRDDGDGLVADCWREGRVRPVRRTQLDPPGGTRGLRIELADGTRLSGRLQTVHDLSAPGTQTLHDLSAPRTQPQPASLVRGRVAREPLAGLLIDWRAQTP